MSLALGLGRGLISRPATTSDLSFLPQPHNATHSSSTLSSPTQIYRRGGNLGGGIKARGGADPLDSSFGLNVCLDGGSSVFRSSEKRGRCRKLLKRFRLMYFRRQSSPAAAGGTVSNLLEESGLRLDGDGGGGSGGGDWGKGGDGGGGWGFDGGDLRMEAFPLWWWWQWQSARPESHDGEEEGLKYDIPIKMVWRPEKESERENCRGKGKDQLQSFIGKVKKFWEDNSETILEAILWPFLRITMVILEPASRRISQECFRPFIPFPIAFLQYINRTVEYSLVVLLLLLSGTALLFLTLLLWWAQRHYHGGGGDSAGDDDDDGSSVDQHSQEDSGGDEDEL